MNPHLTQALAEQRAAELRAAGEAARLARAAEAGRAGRAPRRSRLSLLLPGRRYRRVELVWPDGVCSVVSVPRPSVPADQPARGMAGTRR
ncbi:MAG TPA: hypothetical protein VEH05_13270 [Streptosporangiaceae bacterium]|nr:hypothetical protein [Streptosporangiaceae bacterium]